MNIFKCFDRQQRLAKRKKKLGEKYTSDLTWREFSLRQIIKLNPTLILDNIEYIYEIGWCGGQDKFLDKLKNLIQENKLNKIAKLNNTIEEGQDEMGYTPIGDYLKTQVWTMKDGKTYVQVIKGSFDNTAEEIKLLQKIDTFDIKNVETRKLIYPI
jgi:hypothetical protein